MSYFKSKEEYISKKSKVFQDRIDSYKKDKNYVKYKRFVDSQVIFLEHRINNLNNLSDDDYKKIVDSKNKSYFSEQLSNINQIIIKCEKNQLTDLSYSDLISAEKNFIKNESLINKDEFDRTKKGIQREIRFRKLLKLDK